MELGVCLEMFFGDRPFLERIPAAAEAGCRFGEMWFTDMTVWDGGMREDDPKDPGEVSAAAEKAGLTITSAVIGAPDGSIGGGLTNPANRGQWLGRAEKTFRFCRDAGIGSAIVCTGNRVEGESFSETRRHVMEGLKATVEKADGFGIDLLMEPLNDRKDHPDYFLVDSDAGAEMCREIGSPRLKLIHDCYHMQIMEGDLCGHIRRNLDVIGHLHAGGHPGRHELWLGETDYRFLWKEIERAGYDGVCALEYTPTLEPAESIRRTISYLESGNGR